MAGAVVGCLRAWCVDGKNELPHEDIPIRAGEQFYIGRHPSLCRYTCTDAVISSKHVRIHSFLYEQDHKAAVAPFVYATDLSSNGTVLKKYHADHDNSGLQIHNKGAFLLDNGDELQLPNQTHLLFLSCNPQLELLRQLTKRQDEEKEYFTSQFRLTDRVLGIGGFGKVLVSFDQKAQRQVACKVIDLAGRRRKLGISRLTSFDIVKNPDGSSSRVPSKVAKYFREFEVLKGLNHPNIIAIRKVFWSIDTIYIFQDLITGGDLFSYIDYKGGRLREVDAAVITRQILKGIEYLHRQDIAHRDLKPDNILLASLNDGAPVVITDFGSARVSPISQEEEMFSMVGTLEYTAPEIHSRTGYYKSVDMWSIGCITGTALSGTFLFPRVGDSQQNSYQAAVNAAAKCDLSFLTDGSNACWAKIRSAPKDFIAKLLVLRQDLRMTATQALAHPWFANPAYAAGFTALDQRTNQDWQPRAVEDHLVEPIGPMRSAMEESSSQPVPSSIISTGQAHNIQTDHSSNDSAPRQPRTTNKNTNPKSAPRPIIADSQEDATTVKSNLKATPAPSSSDRIVVLETPPRGVKRAHIRPDSISSLGGTELDDDEEEDSPLLRVSNYASELRKRRRL